MQVPLGCRCHNENVHFPLIVYVCTNPQISAEKVIFGEFFTNFYIAEALPCLYSMHSAQLTSSPVTLIFIPRLRLFIIFPTLSREASPILLCPVSTLAASLSCDAKPLDVFIVLVTLHFGGINRVIYRPFQGFFFN